MSEYQKRLIKTGVRFIPFVDNLPCNFPDNTIAVSINNNGVVFFDADDSYYHANFNSVNQLNNFVKRIPVIIDRQWLLTNTTCF